MTFLADENAVELVAGQTKTLRLVVTDSAGVPVNLTGARVVLTVRCDADAEDPTLVKDSAKGTAEVDVISPREGVVELYLSPSDTRDLDPHQYVYDIWVELSGARYPVVESTFAVKRRITAL